MAKVVGPLARYPARVTFAVYLGLILAASLLLAHPVSRAAGRPAISPVDAAFTATSATCVTGLIVRSTPNDFNVIGQLVILLLIQLGGIGIMTVSTYVLFQLGGREGMQHRVLMTETLGTDTGMELRWVLRNVIFTVLVIEGVGFVLLAARNLFDMPPLLALWHALFHSVSAFCNAGFVLHAWSMFRGKSRLNLFRRTVPRTSIAKAEAINLRRRYGVWVIGVKDVMKTELTMFPDGQFVFGIDQVVLVVGRHQDLDRLREVR